MTLKEFKKSTETKKRVRMLCVTDQKELRDLVHQQFGKFFDLSEASSGEDGISLALQKRPHVVLMDLGMHSLSGVDAARSIKHELPNAKIIMLTMYQCDSCPTGI